MNPAGGRVHSRANMHAPAEASNDRRGLFISLVILGLQQDNGRQISRKT